MAARRDRPAPALSEDTRRLLGLTERLEDTGHRCGRCFGPYGKSSIPCVNEFPEIAVRAARVAAYKEQINSKESAK